MSTICELQLKPPLECIDVFTLLKEKIDLISKVRTALFGSTKNKFIIMFFQRRLCALLKFFRVSVIC
jgi:hypothetical protein